jgi:hypothetical protein
VPQLMERDREVLTAFPVVAGWARWAYEEACAVLLQRVWRGHYVRTVVKPWREYEKAQVRTPPCITPKRPRSPASSRHAQMQS